MPAPPSILVCFALPDEARPFRKLTQDLFHITVITTGMGVKNSERSLLRALESQQPSAVVTSGFAGGLNPAIRVGEIVAHWDESFPFPVDQPQQNIRAGNFHCSGRVAVTPAEKQCLWNETRADAVEMESGVIRAICRDRRIPSATVRIISDAAGDTLPLDFNALATADLKMNWLKLSGCLIRQPSKIGELIKFQKQIAQCADRLGQALHDLVQSR